jgi:hypothetical protein
MYDVMAPALLLLVWGILRVWPFLPDLAQIWKHTGNNRP